MFVTKMDDVKNWREKPLPGKSLHSNRMHISISSTQVPLQFRLFCPPAFTLHGYQSQTYSARRVVRGLAGKPSSDITLSTPDSSAQDYTTSGQDSPMVQMKVSSGKAQARSLMSCSGAAGSTHSSLCTGIHIGSACSQ